MGHLVMPNPHKSALNESLIKMKHKTTFGHSDSTLLDVDFEFFTRTQVQKKIQIEKVFFYCLLHNPKVLFLQYRFNKRYKACY